MSTPNLAAAAQFLAGSARIVDRRRFERLFQDGDAQSVRDAVAAYRNSDQGFGHGLEPDGRTPASQAPAVEMALRILHETDAWDEGLAAGACAWLEANAPAEGGAAFVEATVQGWPHAPWWEPQAGRPASLISTGLIAGTLHARHLEHPWLDRATDLLWLRIDELADPGPYDMLGVLRFLQHVPDRARAQAAFRQVGHLLVDQHIVTMDPAATGEVHRPLDFAPIPASTARSLFSQDAIEADLERLAAGQLADGGWTFNWPAWSPAAELEWRGFVTVEALLVLEANGRLGG